MNSIIFSGQRSQYIGMLETLKDDITIRNTFDRASFILDQDLWALRLDKNIDRTDIAQPLILTAGVALYRSIGCPAGIMAGHSLGEFVALTCAGAIDFEDALHLVALRGKLMNAHKIDGCMGMICGLTYERVLSMYGHLVDIAAINSPTRISIAGTIESVTDVADDSVVLGASWSDIWRTTLPFHSKLMQPVVGEFEEAVNQIHFEVPSWSSVVSNVTGEVYTSTCEIKTNLVKHLTNTVQWAKCIQTIKDTGISNFIEIGPRSILAKLVLENDPHAVITGVHDKETIDKYCIDRNI